MADETAPKLKVMAWADFLAHQAPPSVCIVENATFRFQPEEDWTFFAPNLTMHCDSERCGGERIYEAKPGAFLGKIGEKKDFLGRPIRQERFLTYQCKNCTDREKVFALMIQMEDVKEGTLRVWKLGELPFFSPHVPSRVITLIRDDLELFLQGRRSENSAQGIGAFVYYRRVVVNQWGRLLDEIIRVSTLSNAKAEVIASLETAKKETRFKDSVKPITPALPASLMIGDRNPLTLLHGALSVGIHDLSDDQCLERAADVRLVLTELANRIGEVLKNRADVNEAVARLSKLGDNSDPAPKR